MIKRISGGLLTAAILMGMSGTAFMNNNPYADVPEGDWSYDAMASLVHQNLVRGVTDKTFDKNEIITRDDMAVLVAKALSKESVVDPDTKSVINKLAQEYAYELKIIGVDSGNGPAVDPASAVNKIDKFFISGTGRIRLDKGHTGGVTAQKGNSIGNYTPNSHVNLDLNYGYKINDKWTFKGESEYGRQLNYGGENETLQNSVFEQMYLTGPIADGVTVRAGRFSTFSPNGLVYDDKVTGGGITFGNKVTASIDAGKATSTDDNTSTVTVNGQPYDYHSQNYQSILINAPLSKVTNLQAGYYRIGGNVLQHQIPNNYVNYYTAGLSTTLAKNLYFNTAFSKSNAKAFETSGILSKADTAYLFRLTYKKADFTVPKTFDIFAMYRRSPQLSGYSNTDDWCQNVKGIRIGGDYTMTKNIGLTAWYTFGKDVDTNERNNMYRLECDFLI